MIKGNHKLGYGDVCISTVRFKKEGEKFFDELFLFFSLFLQPFVISPCLTHRYTKTYKYYELGIIKEVRNMVSDKNIKKKLVSAGAPLESFTDSQTKDMIDKFRKDTDFMTWYHYNNSKKISQLF